MNTPENTTTRIDGKPTTPETDAARDEGAPDAAPMGNVEDVLAKFQSELAQHRDDALRQRADLENTRKRLQREKEEAVKYANSVLLERLLPVVDNFEMGMMEAKRSAEGTAVMVGMSMVQKQLEDFLREQGMDTIDAVGQKFDPNLHEALGEEPSSAVPEGHVIRQIRKGYKLRDRLIRAANVFHLQGARLTRPTARRQRLRAIVHSSFAAEDPLEESDRGDHADDHKFLRGEQQADQQFEVRPPSPGCRLPPARPTRRRPPCPSSD